MTKIKVDTVKLKECGENLLTMNGTFHRDINSLYNRIYNVPITTKEWVGEAANNYANLLMNEKPQYNNYSKVLNMMGNVLINYSNDIEEAVRQTKI